MSQIKPLVLGLFLLTQFSAPALADLDKNQKRALTRIESLEKTIAKDLEKYSPEKLKTNLNSRAGYKRIYDNLQRKFKEIEEKMQGLPVDDPQVLELKQQLQTQKDKAEELLKLVEGAESAIQAREDATRAYTESEEFEQDKKILAQIEQSFENYSELDLMAERHKFHYTDHAIIEAAEIVQAWRKAEADFEALIKKRDAKGINHRTGDFIQGKYDKGKAEIAKIQAQGLKILKPLVSETEQKLQTVGAAKDYRALSDSSSEVSRLIRRVQVTAEYVKAFNPDTQSQVEQMIQSLKNRQESLIDGMAKEIIAANRFAPNKYSGNDLGAVKQFVTIKWKSQFPKDTLLQIRFGDSWHRTTRWQWNTSASAWDWKDYSILYGQILVKLDNAHAVSYDIRVIKRHTQNNQLDLGWDRTIKPKPDQTYLLKNI